jgi:hypothetical protein
LGFRPAAEQLSGPVAVATKSMLRVAGVNWLAKRRKSSGNSQCPDTRNDTLGSGFLNMATELVAHGRKQLIRELGLSTRREAIVERR